jgi:hypothetical protein
VPGHRRGRLDSLQTGDRYAAHNPGLPLEDEMRQVGVSASAELMRVSATCRAD